EAKGRLPVDDTHPIHLLWHKLPDLLGEANQLHFHLGLAPEYDREVIRALAVHKGRHGKKQLSAKLPVHDAQVLAGKLRLRKGPDEVERLRAAAAVSRKSYEKIFRAVRPGLSERDVHGLILGEFLANGGEMEAYGSIVAGGANACVLHYR